MRCRFSSWPERASDSRGSNCAAARCASKRVIACPTVAAVAPSMWNRTGRSCGGGSAAGVPAGGSTGSALAQVKTSSKYRSTAAPSPHACSKLTPARPLAHTTSWNDLSNHRSRPVPCSVDRESSTSPSGDEGSSETTNTAESIACTASAFPGPPSRWARAAAHSSRPSVVSIPTGAASDTGAARMARMLASICGCPTSPPALSSTSKA
mmetsp:Transcript_12855/g.38642  ORF Transcript_12855/g.38642 Transcript_12855/m.38642 type:complete len:209 (+) Transcript_12855:562-1188(+)